MFTFAELTAGIGTGRLALEGLGGKHIWSCEIDPGCKKEYKEGDLKLRCEGEHHMTDDITSECDICNSRKTQYARITYRENFGEYQTYGNIRELKNPPYADIIVSGFPCPSFSIAGDRKGFEDSRGEIFFEVSRIIGEVQPKAFILENVEGLLSHDKGRTFKTIIKELGAQGYLIHHKLLNSTDFGVPQNRPRVYLVGFRRDIYNPLSNRAFAYPRKMKLEKTVADILEPEVDEKYYLSERMVKHLMKRMDGKYSKPHISDGKDISRSIRSGGNASGMTSNTTFILDAYNDKLKHDGITGALKAEGTSGKTGHYIFQEFSHSGENGKGRGIREYMDTSPALTQQMGTGGGNVPMIKKGMRLRKFTPKECFRLQGFLDSFVDKAISAGLSDTQLYRQAGNAFTFQVVKAVAECVLKTLEALE